MNQVTLYNTLSHKKEILQPIHSEWVGLYTCGPTVYNFTHIGNFRTYIFEDILHRTLGYAGYNVKHVMNITDVDDKIIRDSLRDKKTIFEFVAPYTSAFLEDLVKLNIASAWMYPKATAHVKEMIVLIQTLLDKNIAYEKDGSVYFSISKFKKYGKLSRVEKRELKAGARVDADEYAKENVQDFVLWKASKLGEPSWEAPFGKGRPGWHIECSAMSMKYLGETFDIHAGGVDLIFPHHENEIAQSEGATDKTFAHIFIEGEHLLVNGEKMAKSLGNVFTLRDLETKHINPLCYRYLALGAHYRSKLNFTWESLEAAQNSLEKLYAFVRELKLQNHKGLSPLLKTKEAFSSAVFNDLDTPKALAVIWKLIRDYRKVPSEYNSKDVLSLLYEFDTVLGLRLKHVKLEEIPGDIALLVQKREEYRKAKEWDKADETRKKIQEKGYSVEDSAKGPKIKKI